jgi:hypothetical protein
MGSIPGAHTGDGRFDGETLRLAERLSQDGRAPNSPVYVIYYMLSSGGFAAACLQVIAKGGSSILGRPGQTRAMFQASTPVDLLHSDDSGGAVAFRSTTDSTEKWV